MSNTPPEDKAKSEAWGRGRRDTEEMILKDGRAKHAYLAHMRHGLRTEPAPAMRRSA